MERYTAVYTPTGMQMFGVPLETCYPAGVSTVFSEKSVIRSMNIVVVVIIVSP